MSSSAAPSPAPPAAQAPAPRASPLTLALTPDWRLLLEPGAPEEVAPAPEASRRLREALEVGTPEALLHLGSVEVTTPLPPAFAFWRDFARACITAVLASPDSATPGAAPRPTAPAGEHEARCAAAPWMAGSEDLSPAALSALWTSMLDALDAELRCSQRSAQDHFARTNPAWKAVGRVHLHLAENKKDPSRPFAFLATFSTGVSPSGRPQFRPLGQAIEDGASAKDRQRLLALLSPLQRAAGQSPFIEELLQSRALFQPLAWTPSEALRFLKDVPALEVAGVVVRAPVGWRTAAPARPRVTVSVGSAAPSRLGADALLDFDVRVTLDGEPLTAAELRALRDADEGLVLLKGRWVEVDRERLDGVLSRWKQLEDGLDRGLSVIEAMRLVSGLSREGVAAGEDVAPELREWSAVQAGPWLRALLDDLRGDREQPALLRPLEGALRAVLRPYQRRGVAWLWLLGRLGLGACLADDMGLGKTVQVLALLLLHQQRGDGALPGPHLLVVPASLLGNWRAEAERFAPSLRLRILHGSTVDRAALSSLGPGDLVGCDLVVTTYGQLTRLAWLREVEFGLVILDEAQAIKNPAIRQTRTVKALRSRARIALTGTPVENRLTDLWSLFDFVSPGLLGTSKALGAFVKRSGEGSYAPLRKLIRPYLLRRLKTDREIVPDLPDKTELLTWCGLSPRQAALYQEAVASLRRTLEDVDPMERRGQVLAHLMRFKQLCNHPSHWLGDGGYAPEESGKFLRVRELCETIAGRRQKALFFTQFQELAGPLAAYVGGLFGRAGLVLTGKTPVRQRTELVRAFQEDAGLPFMVLTVKAGGVGLNLTAASHVVHFDRWWNPAVEDQATDRAYRIGQKQNVLVHKLVCRGTVEERIDGLLAQKKQLSRDLVGEGGEVSLTELDDEALLGLVSLDLHSALEE